MTHYCKYHPIEPANWYCSGCRIQFCDSCSPDVPDDPPGSPHYCMFCRGELSVLGAGHSALPFWQRLTDFLQYPFSPLGLGMLLLALLVPMIVPDGVPLHLARVLFLVLATAYSYIVFQFIASGQIEAFKPQELIKAKDLVADGVRLGALLAIILAGEGYLFTHNYMFVGSVLLAILVSALPAMVMAVACNRSVMAAVQGESLKTVLAAIGPGYASLPLLLLVLLATLQSLVSLFVDILPVNIGHALELTVHTYFFIVLMSVSGYVLFQYQEAMGFVPSLAEGGGNRRTRNRVPDRVMIQVDILLKEGMYPKAVAILANEISKKTVTPQMHERYHRLVWALNNQEALTKHAPAYFKSLLGGDRDHQALSLLRAYLSRDNGFRPADPEICLRLAQVCYEAREYKLAVHVLSNMHKDTPHFPGLPEAYMLAARILNENLGLPQKALALVEYLDQRYKTHRIYPEIRAYRAQLLAANVS